MNKILIVAACALIMAPAFVSCKDRDMKKSSEGPVVLMETSAGTMKIVLYDATPQHRDNFLKLVREGFYDGVKFHRVIPGFMIQAGDPLSKDDSARDSWGTGGPGYTVPAEFVSGLKHCKGALAAARIGDMANPRRASSGSQFYIVQDSLGCAHLDGQYTVFGRVIEGLDVIDAIAAVSTDPYDRPLMPVVIEKVVEEGAVAVKDSISVESADTLSDKIK